MRDYAQRLLAYEAHFRGSGEPDAAAVLRIFEALRRSLSTLVGANGFRVLMARTLTLAKPEAPSLGHLQVSVEGYLKNPAKQTGVDGHCEFEGPEPGIVLIIHLFTLLVALIGETMLLQILLDVWPDAGLSDAMPSGRKRQ